MTHGMVGCNPKQPEITKVYSAHTNNKLTSGYRESHLSFSTWQPFDVDRLLNRVLSGSLPAIDPTAGGAEQTIIGTLWLPL